MSTPTSESRQGKYLNGVLTLNAIALGALLWTQLVQPSVGPSQAEAQVRTIPHSVRPGSPGIPNAGAQRMKMIEQLEDLEDAVAALAILARSGEIQVQVGNLDELSAEADSDR